MGLPGQQEQPCDPGNADKPIGRQKRRDQCQRWFEYEAGWLIPAGSANRNATVDIWDTGGDYICLDGDEQAYVNCSDRKQTGNDRQKHEHTHSSLYALLGAPFVCHAGLMP